MPNVDSNTTVRYAVSEDILIVVIQEREGGLIVLTLVKGTGEGHLINKNGIQEGHVHTPGIERGHDQNLGVARDHDHSLKLERDHAHIVGVERGRVQALKIGSGHVPDVKARKDQSHIQKTGHVLILKAVQGLKKSLETKGEFSFFNLL